MAAKEQMQETCEACGCVAEVGTIINEGDDVLHLTLSAANEADAKALLVRYEALARQISAEVQVTTVSRNVAELVELDVTLLFGCTAEKLIFEMRARTL